MPGIDIPGWQRVFMNGGDTDPGGNRTRIGPAWAFAAVCLAVLLVSLYGPYLNDALTGDDYEWLEHARNALEHPGQLFTDLGGFYRPAATWTWAVAYLIGKDRPWVHHGVNLMLLWVDAGLWILFLFRLGFPLPAAAVMSALWACSPFLSESGIACSSRFDTLLWMSWLLLGLVWPRRAEGWTTARGTAAAVLVFFAMTTKETWVVTPVWMAVLARSFEGTSWRKAGRAFLGGLLPVTVYSVIYFHHFPLSQKGYFVYSFTPLKKIPVMIGSFFETAPLQAAGFHLDLRHFGAFVMFFVMAVYLIRRAPARAYSGMALVFLPALPTLMSPYLPQRWLTLPYAGAILLAGALVMEGDRLLTGNPRRRLVRGLILLAALLMLTGHAFRTRLDLDDFHRVAEVHEQLLKEARAILPGIPSPARVLAVRAETVEPLLRLRRKTRGQAKTYFLRRRHPYSLVETRALFDYAGIPYHRRARPLSSGYKPAAPFLILLHYPGRFVLARPSQPDPDRERAVLEGKGYRTTTFFME